jgi:hypothetical protein
VWVNSRYVFVLIVTVGALSAVPAVGGIGASDAAAASGKARGTLVLQLTGLPPGERGEFSLSGPGGLRRSLATARPTTRLKVKAGTYRVRVSRVELRRSHRSVRRGALASPVRRKLRVKVRAKRVAKLRVRYGTIVNPGVRNVSGRVAAVLGNPRSPSGVVLRPGAGAHRGSILSARPSQILPLGLLVRVTAVAKRDRKTLAVVRPASIYQVAPNMIFDIPLTATDGAQISQVIKCGDPTAAGVKPYVELSDFRASGGWTTVGWGRFRVPNGAQAEVHFRAAVGVKADSRAGLSCRLNLPTFGFQGFAGPIPVYGGVRPGASVELGGNVNASAEGSAEITVGGKVSGVPPGASPIVGFSSPRFTFKASAFASIKAGLSLAAELGLGAINGGNLHVDLTNSLNFTAAPGNCSWDLELGSFGAGGELGPLSISTPSTPPAYHKNLWQNPCGPPSPPAPPPPPAPVGPLVRATMDWNTDSDIDLYVWDEAGNLSYFGDRDGIPGSELVEDIIPTSGEAVHPREIFRETTNPNRRYTFGICDYAGEGADVTLTVTDPGGAQRTFPHTLFYEGDYELITTSPSDGGYTPGFGWCRYLND